MAKGGWILLAVMLAGCASEPAGPGTAPGAGVGGSQATPAQAQGAPVTVTGNVARKVIPWQDGLTLMQAFAISGYQGAANPSQLGIIRKGQMPVYMDYQKLYDGQDMMLEPGDRVDVRP